MRSWLLLLAPLLALAGAMGCLGSGGARGASAPRVAPEGREERNAAVERFGRRAWGALVAGQPAHLVFDDLELRALLEPAEATRFSARRLTLAPRLGRTEELPARLAGAAYAGVCVQGARLERAGGALGLRAAAWAFDRALIIGRRAEGQRVASWIEGPFLFSDAGFGALDLERVEAPRWEHSDLELAECDVAVRQE